MSDHLANGVGFYRTGLLTEAKARGFAKCLHANAALFRDVWVHESRRAKAGNPIRWFVQWQPAGEAGRAWIQHRQQGVREQRAAHEGVAYLWAWDPDEKFWRVLTCSGQVYELSPTGDSCSCPDFEIRCRPAGIQCKHAAALKQGVGTWIIGDWETVGKAA